MRRTNLAIATWVLGGGLHAQHMCPAEVRPDPVITPEVVQRAQSQLRGGGDEVTLYIKAFTISSTAPSLPMIHPWRIQEDLDECNRIFAESGIGIQFALCGPVQDIQNDNLYFGYLDLPVIGTHFEYGYLNVFRTMYSPIQGVSGMYLADMILLSDYANGSVLAHEIGHALGLHHTHELTYGAEFVNGSNCTVAGDLICDTPADPMLGAPGMVDSECAYIGTSIDPNGDPYSPMTRNVMSYAWCYLDTLTAGQGAVMRYVLDSVKTYLRRSTEAVAISPFPIRFCRYDASWPLQAAPAPGFFDGPAVMDDQLVQAGMAPGPYFAHYTPAQVSTDSAERIDQYSLYAHSVLVTDSVWQSLRAGLGGTLAAVEFPLYAGTSTLVRVRVFEGTGPVGPSLIDTTIAVVAMADTAWVRFDLPPGLVVAMGDVLTFLLTADAPTAFRVTMGTNMYDRDYLHGQSSAGGQQDLVFRTRVHGLPPCADAWRYYHIFAPPAQQVISLGSAYCALSTDTVWLVGSSPDTTDAVFLMNGEAVGSILPAAWGEGTHYINYVYTAEGCADTIAQSFDVLSPPDPVILDLESPICMGGTPLPLAAEPPGGDFTINGAPAELFVPDDLGTGTHEVSYSFTAMLDSITYRDQFCCNVPSGWGFTTMQPGTSLLQSFTPAHNGTMHRFEMRLDASVDDVAFATRLYAGDGVDGPLLAAETILIPMYTNQVDLFGPAQPWVWRDSTYTVFLERLTVGPEGDAGVLSLSTDHYMGGMFMMDGQEMGDLWFSQHVTHIERCTGTESLSVEVEICTGLQVQPLEGLLVGPCPFDADLWVTSPADMSYELFDGVGRAVLHGRMQAGERVHLSTAKLSAGIYSLRGSIPDGRTFSTRLVHR